MSNEINLATVKKDAGEIYAKSIPFDESIIFLTDNARTHVAELVGHKLLKDDDTGERRIVYHFNITETTRPSRNRSDGEEVETIGDTTKSPKASKAK